jgi:cyclase
MSPQRITPKVIVETEYFGSNNSIVVGSEGLLLIDSPHCLSDAKKWRKYAEQFGQIRFVVNSDHHPDHTIGNYVMPGDVVGHTDTRERLLSSEAPSREYLVDLMKRIDPKSVSIFENEYQVRAPNIVFDSKMDIHLGDASVELTHRPGHTRNSVITYFAEDKVIFSGDIVCEAGLPSFQDSKIVDWFDALDAVDCYDYVYVVPGHGAVTDRAGVQRYRELGRQVVTQVAERMNRGHELQQVAEEIRFEDNIHVATDSCAGYSDDMINIFQLRSISRIYQDLQETPDLVSR